MMEKTMLWFHGGMKATIYFKTITKIHHSQWVIDREYFYPRTIREWNLLPANVANAGNLEAFKVLISQLHQNVPVKLLKNCRMDVVKCIYHTGPVTALHVLDKNVIAGCGDYLYLYDVDTTQCLQRISALPCTRIHGIRSHNGNHGFLCVFGEKKSCIVKVDKGGLTATDRRIELKDWIWDAVFLNVNEASRREVVFALAHNTIIRWDSDRNQILDVVQCEENSILYCARFITADWNKLILAAGTVINQVLLWSPMTTRNNSGHCTVMHRFKGHQGVIFSVRYNPHRHQICSVSDDRSIRIWQLTFTGKNTMATSNLDLENWKQCQNTPLHVLYGHSARVWDINLLSHVMISIGEDSLCCVWNYNGEVIQKFKGHKGKNIWSLASDEQDKFFVTGGGDTSIRMWKLQQTENQSESKIQCQNLPFPEKDDFVRTVSFWRSDYVLGMTNEGSLLIYSLTDGYKSVIFTDVNFKSYTVMSVSDAICVGNIKGTLRIIYANETDKPQKMKFIWKDYDIYSGKVFSIQWLSDIYLLTTGPDGEINFYYHVTRKNDIGDFNLMKKFCLPSCKQRWVSAAALTTDERSLICGDRAGTVHVYNWGELGDKMQDPVQSFWKIHGKTGVTDIRRTEDIVYTCGRDGHYRTFKIDNDRLTLLNSNRVSKGFDWLDKLELQSDDDIFIYGFQSVSLDFYTNKTASHYTTEMLLNVPCSIKHTDVSSFLCNACVESFRKICPNKKLQIIIDISYQDSFILFSTYNNQRLVQIPCGGGHRTWDCQIVDNKVKFVYLKMKEVVLCCTDLLTNQVMIKESLHGRETTCVKHLYRYLSDDNQPADIIVTCSEDTTVLISNLTYNDKGVMKLSRLHTFRDHISNVKCMTFCASYTTGSHLFFTGGSRAQLVVTRITLKEDTDRCGVKTSFQTLKSCHLGEEWLTRKQKKLKSFRSNPETRIMDLCVVPLRDIIVDCQGHLYVLGSACSDGYVRFYVFDEKFQILTPVCESVYHDHCVLKIVHTFITNKDARHCIFLSAGTDGKIALWEITKHLTKFLSGYKYHSVKTLQGNDKLTTSPPHSKNGENILTNQNPDKSNQVNLVEMSKVLADDSEIVDTTYPSENSSSEKNSDVYEEDDRINEPLFVISSHQSGINGISTLDLHEGKLLLATGGDDNCLGISIVTLQESNSIKLDTKCQELSAHAAQITGVCILNSSKIMTASVDQRMCLWDIDYTESVPRLSLVWCKFVNVPDIVHMEVWPMENKLTVGLCGEGLSIFEVEINKT